MPLLLYFHGQGSEAKSDADGSKYDSVGEKEGFATLYLQGIGKEDGGKCGTGWYDVLRELRLSTHSFVENFFHKKLFAEKSLC